MRQIHPFPSPILKTSPSITVHALVSVRVRNQSMMPGLQGGPSPHRWNQIRRLPLDPAIRTLEQYEQAVMIGTLDVLEKIVKR